MKKRVVIGLFLSLLLVLLHLVFAGDTSYSSQKILIPNESGKFAIDISTLTEAQTDFFEDSLTRLQKEGDIISFEQKNGKMIIEMNNKNDLIIDFNSEGIFVSKPSKSYIVEFKKPAALAQAQPGESIGIQSYQQSSYRKELESEHSAALRDIEEKLKGETGEEGQGEGLANLGIIQKLIEILKNLFGITGHAVSEPVSEPEIKVEKEFYNVFNGVVLEVSKEEALKIQESEYVKKVYENREVRAFLYNSTSVVRANGAWQLDEDGNNCSQTGKACINGEGVKIAIIDTGIDYTHTDLGGCFGPGCKVEGGYDIVNQDTDPMDDMGHGTHCAGIAAGDGTLKGVAPKATLYAYKVLDSGGSGTWDGVIEGIERAVDPNQDGNFSDKADVLSLSLGGEGDPDDPVSTAVDNAVNAGAVTVVSAGNSGPYSETIGSPGTARNALTVGATWKNDYEGDYWSDENPKTDQITSFSSRGPVVWDGGSLNKPDIVAPGALICSARYDTVDFTSHNPLYTTCLDEKHVQLAGTSMSAPHVAGGAALVIQAKPQLTALEVRSLLISSADDLGYDINTQGSGRMNVLKALNSSIVFSTNKIDFGNIKVDPVSKTLTVKNIGSQEKTIKFSVNQSYSNLINLSAYTVTLPAKSEHSITVTIHAPAGVGGVFSGEIKASEGNNNYSIDYSASRFSELKLKVEGNHFPHFVIYNYALDETKYAEQDLDFLGNEYTFKVSPGEYYVYAINDYIGYGETDKYILMDKINVILDSDAEKIFRLSDAGLFTLDAKSVKGEVIPLFEFEEGLVAYPKGNTTDDSVLRLATYDLRENQRQIYLSNAPAGELDNDILLRYFAAADPKKMGEELYAGGWILHNLNGSTPTTITFDHKNSAKYNFTFNMPGFGLKYSRYILDFSDPLGGYYSSRYLDIGAPLKQKVYAYVSNPVPKNYHQNFSLNVYTDLKICPSLDNNIVASYSQETISSGYSDSLNPASKEEKEFYFGGPYIPGSVMTKDGVIIIRNKLLNLKGGGLVEKDSETSGECCGTSCSSYYLDLERPRYQIYKNGLLVKEGNLTSSYGYWEEGSMGYYFEESKNYFVKFTIPAYYPIFNKTVVSASFSTARTDRQPPWLTNLEILPRFKEGENLNLTIDAEDNIGISNVTSYYENGSGWKEIALSRTGNHFTGAIRTSGEKIDLKIVIIDTSGNNQTYEIYPVSYKEKSVSTSIDPISSEINPGDKISVKGYAKDSQGNGVNGLLVKLFSNGEYLWSIPSYKYSSTRQGYFSDYYTVPLDYSGQLNITAETLATGSYGASSSGSFTKNVTRYAHDVAVMNMTMPDEDSVTIGEIKTAKASIANLGNNAETVTISLIEDYYDEETVIGAKQVILNPGELSEQEFSFAVRAGYLYYAVEASISSDESPSNNLYTYYWYKNPEYDVSAYVSTSDSSYYINYSKIIIGMENEGEKDIENISYTLEIAKNCYSEDETCNYELRDSGKVDYLKEGGYKSIESSSKLQDEGYYMLKLTLSAPQDQYLDNNVDYYSVRALKPSPDASVSFSWSDNYYREYIVGIPNNITVKLYNSGSETAEDITAYLYKYYYNEDTYEEGYTFVDSIRVDSLAVKTNKNINFLWTPDKVGLQEFYVNISSKNDSNQWNNYDWTSLTAVKNETDLNISEIYLREPYKVNEESYIRVRVNNLGRTTKRINISFYDNEVLIENATMSSIAAGDYDYGYFYWTPTQTGAHKLKFVVETEGDTDTSNNVKEINTLVYDLAQVTFKLKDSQGNPVSRYIISEDYFQMSSSYPAMEEYYVDGEKTFDVVNLSISGKKLPIKIVYSLDNWYSDYYDEMKEGMVTILVDIPFNETIEITSDYNDKVTERNNSYYLVFANEIAQEQDANYLELARNLTYLNSQGIGSGSYPAYCEDYNLVNKRCEGYWKAPNYFYSGSYSSYNIRYYEANEDLGRVEAISATKSIDFDCGTTNLSSQVSSSISNFTLERCPYGRIRFPQKVYINYFKSYPYYLAQHVKIEPGVLGVNTTESSMYDLRNKTAQLLFRNIDMRKPQILRDGELCNGEICSNFNYNKDTKTITLDVKEFSEFRVVEGPYCGDGACQLDYGEDCAECVADCGCISGYNCVSGSCKADETPGPTGPAGPTGPSGPATCTPNWNCTWTLCTNNIQTYNCVDKKNCGTRNGRPSSHGTTKACTANQDCVDNDKDGYGIGKDCLGPDINDNDPGITDTIISTDVENPDTTGGKIGKFLKDNFWYILIIFVGLVLIATIILSSIAIVKATKKKEDNRIEISEKKIKEKNRKFE